MTTSAAPRNAYTDAPELHPNLILGSLQVLFWIFFHPSAWRNHIARIDPTLRPDFCLAELSWTQWRNPTFRRLLYGYVVWTLLVIALVAAIWWGKWHAPSVALLIWWIGQSILYGMVFSITVSISVSFAVGIVSCVVVGSAAGILSTSGYNPSIFNLVVFTVAASMIASVAGNLAGHQKAYPLFLQVGSVVIGIVMGMGTTVIAAGIATGAIVLIIVGLKSSLPETIVNGLVAGIAGGAVGGTAFLVRIGRLKKGVFIGTLVGFSLGLLTGSPFEIKSVAGVILFGLLLSAMFALPYLLAARIGGVWAGAIAGALGGGASALSMARIQWPLVALLDSVSPILVLALPWLLPILLYPFLAAWNLLLLRLDMRRSVDHFPFLRRHSAFWNESQRLPLLGLEDHLVLIAERSPSEGQAAIEYLSTSRQRWAAQAAQIELDARRLEHCQDVHAISLAHRSLAAGELTSPAGALLRSFSRISQDVDAAQRQESAYNQRLALSAIEDRLDGLLRELTRSSERYAVRFRPIANKWRQTVADHVRQLAETVEARQEIDNPYVIGVPLTEQQEIFVGRTDISARIEQLLLDRRRPPLLLYGQRRMGKTSLLNNLGRLLPSTIVPLFVDLQGPATQASGHAGFLYNIARGILDSASKQRGLALPPLPRETLEADPFTRFDEWLNEVERALGQNTVLLALDEFEALDSAITKGRFEEERVLGMLRHLIQHRPRFKVLLAGSHTLDELQRWASYLINVQVVQISYLQEVEARQLVERPAEDFALRYEPDASQRVLALTRGHPFLVQLLCAEIVALKNEQEPAVRRLACLADVEAAVPEALSHGSFFFADIERNQVDAAGLALLRFMAAQGEKTTVSREALAQQVPDSGTLDNALDLCLRRELIEPTDGGYHFQVELIRCWFAPK